MINYGTFPDCACAIRMIHYRMTRTRSDMFAHGIGEKLAEGSIGGAVWIGCMLSKNT